MKKQILTMTFAAMLGAAVLTGCSGSSTTATTAATTAATEAATTVAETTAATEAETTAAETTVASKPEVVDLTGHTLMIYCGAGMTNPFQEIADAFKAETGCEMNVTFANAGQIQSQISTSEEGDMFIAGSGDELKPVESYVAESKDLVKHIPVLAVQTGNPKNIQTLADLTGDGISLIMGDVESTPIGKIAKKALTDAGIFEKVDIAATTTTAPQMATAIAAGEADAAIVWKENCKADGVEIVANDDMAKYTKTIPAASLTSSADADALNAFNAYLDTDTAKEIWKKFGYEIVE